MNKNRLPQCRRRRGAMMVSLARRSDVGNRRRRVAYLMARRVFKIAFRTETGGVSRGTCPDVFDRQNLTARRIFDAP
jgi:hypothetical protein